MFLYWIHHKDHNNPMKEGYIGITNRSVHERFSEHKKSSNKHLNNAFNKYGEDIIVDILIESNEDMCISLEKKYRPIENIGWNICNGGGIPPSPKGKIKTETHCVNLSNSKKGKYFGGGFKKGHKHSEETKQKIKNARAKQVFSDDWSEKISHSLKGKAKPPRSKEHIKKQAEASAKSRKGKKRGPYKRNDEYSRGYKGIS